MALIKLLSENAVIDHMPEGCEQWTSPSRYAEWHAERIAAFKNSAINNLPSIVILLYGVYLI